MLVQSLSLFEAFNLCVAFGGAVPSIPAKYDFLLEKPSRITNLYFAFLTSLSLPVMALPFICARVSAIASLGTFGALAVYTFVAFWTQMDSTVNAIWAMQYREACRAMDNAAKESERAGRPEHPTSMVVQEIAQGAPEA